MVRNEGEKVNNDNTKWGIPCRGNAVIDYELDEDGMVNLLEAVLRKAGADYYDEIPIDGNLTNEQRKIERFIRMIYGSKKGQGIIDTLRRTHPLLNRHKGGNYNG